MGEQAGRDDEGDGYRGASFAEHAGRRGCRRRLAPDRQPGAERLREHPARDPRARRRRDQPARLPPERRGAGARHQPHPRDRRARAGEQRLRPDERRPVARARRAARRLPPARHDDADRPRVGVLEPGLPPRPGRRGARGDRAAHPRARRGARARAVAADRDAAVHRARLRHGHLDRPARGRPARDGAPARTRPPPHPARRRPAGVLRGRRPPPRLRGEPRRGGHRAAAALRRRLDVGGGLPRGRRDLARMPRPSSAGTTRWRSG